MNVQNNKSDSQSPAVKGTSSPKSVDEQEVKLVEVEDQWKMEKGRSHHSNVQSDNHFSSAASQAAAQGSSFEPSGQTATTQHTVVVVVAMEQGKEEEEEEEEGRGGCY